MNTLTDRNCDHGKCSAEALVIVRPPGEPSGAELQFCGHHFHRTEQSLSDQGWIMMKDTRAKLVQNRTKELEAEGAPS